MFPINLGVFDAVLKGPDDDFCIVNVSHQFWRFFAQLSKGPPDGDVYIVHVSCRFWRWLTYLLKGPDGDFYTVHDFLSISAMVDAVIDVEGSWCCHILAGC